MEDRLKMLPFILGMLIVTSCVHEAGHAWAAWRLGDRRDYIKRRVSPWSLSHISLPFTIILPVLLLLFTGFMMGGAKPVQVRLAIGPGRMALVALAGPIGNFFVGLLSIAVMAGVVHLDLVSASVRYDWIYQAMAFSVMISFFLGFLNLIPIPPLDGSRIIAVLLPERLRMLYYRLTVPTIVLLALFFFGMAWFYPEKLQAINMWLLGLVHEWTLDLRNWIQT